MRSRSRLQKSADRMLGAIAILLMVSYLICAMGLGAPCFVLFGRCSFQCYLLHIAALGFLLAQSFFFDALAFEFVGGDRRKLPGLYLGVRAMLVEHDEQDAADHEDDDGGPDVGAQPQNHCGVVDAHVFDPGAAQSVPHQVHGELLASPKAVGELMAKVDDDRGADEVPDHLIQECGVEQGGFVVGALSAGIADFGFADGVRVVEFQTPRQGGGPPVEFLVEPVAESADGLGHGQRG